jgi:hypothetical protein
MRERPQLPVSVDNELLAYSQFVRRQPVIGLDALDRRIKRFRQLGESIACLNGILDGFSSA